MLLPESYIVFSEISRLYSKRTFIDQKTLVQHWPDCRRLKVSHFSNPSQCASKLTLEQLESHLCPRSWLFVIETIGWSTQLGSTLLNRTTIRKNKGTNIIILPRLHYPCSVLIIKVPCLSSMLIFPNWNTSFICWNYFKLSLTLEKQNITKIFTVQNQKHNCIKQYVYPFV